ncbi:phosphate ABC transporter permease PstA [Kitasatospora purpeofusca]|uniref:phosphate ABC transporter permease PstA n=1 Tax=Kitasatospora purpeofusca TaxID=67352 RepID=UPI00224DB0A8|nr:phosphate ABC transporter permease PstA [Kitasatospora purpeofusca]MCX4686659.1 phosphate ABC transporter permease PstA [Kitasatospora purpeofusca]
MTTLDKAPAEASAPTAAPGSAPAPGSVPGPAATAPERKLKLGGVTREDVFTVLGALVGSLGLDWVLYERVLPFSGALGFLLCWYLLFLIGYFGLGRLQWGGLMVRERLASVVAWSSGALVLGLIADQIGYVASRGYEAAQHGNFFTETMERTASLSPITSGGAIHAVVGSLEQLGLATLFAVPLGIAAAVFMSEVGGRMARPVRTLVEAMTALPSIVAGLFILGVVILTFGFDKSGFAASLALTVMMMPIVTRAAEVVIRLVPGTLREASYALGGSQWRTVWNVVLPTAKRGLVTAVVLGMARAVGETSPVLLTAGFTSRMNANPFEGHQISLPLYIWSYVKLPVDQMVARAFAAALTLMAVVLILFVTARILGGRAAGEMNRRQKRRLARAEREARAPRPSAAGPSFGAAPAAASVAAPADSPVRSSATAPLRPAVATGEH